jgi:hypothetical protein
MDVMDLIEKEAVLAPLQVLSILALNPRLPLHVAANYMSSTLKVCVCLLLSVRHCTSVSIVLLT